MARRRRKSAGPGKPLLLLALLGALGYAGWRYGPEAWRTYVASNPPSQQTPLAHSPSTRQRARRR